MIEKVGMIVKFNILGYLIKEGIRNTLKNKKSTVASLIIMCATMLIFGLFFVVTENINSVMEQIEAQQGIQVFIENDATQAQITELREKIQALDGVNNTQFVTKEEALNTVKNQFKDRKNLLAGYDEKNPFPASYIVTVTDLSKIGSIAEQIRTFENVNDITSKDQTTDALLSIANGIKIFSGIILVFLVVISIFIISNTIKLTVHARRREISIMKYVGATNNFIRGPFIVEGIIMGLVSAMLSIGFISLIYDFVAGKIMASQLMGVIGISLLTFNEIFNLILVVYLILGIGIGVLGSILSMKKYLEV